MFPPQRLVAANAAKARDALAMIEKKYANGRMTRGQYLSQREQLHRLLQLPVSPRTAIADNAKGFFMRNLIDNSPAPVGYFDNEYNGRQKRKYHSFWNTSGENTHNIKAPNRRMAPINQVRSSLLEMQKEEYWNWEGDLNNVLRKNMMANNNASNQTEVAQLNNNLQMSHFQNTQNLVNQQLGRLGVTKVDENTYPQIMQMINLQPEVQSALQILLDSIETAVVRQVNVGWSQQEATNNIIIIAKEAGAKLNEFGYDPKAAETIIARLVKGEISELGAIYAVAGDIKEAANIISSIGANTNGTINQNSGLFNNAYATNPSTAPPSNAVSNIQMPSNPTPPSQQQGLRPRNAPSSLQQNIRNPVIIQNQLEYTRRATARQAPDVMIVVKDIMTIDANLIFDYTAGNPIIINPDGSFTDYKGSISQQNLLSQQTGSQIRPEGKWSILTNMMPQMPGASLSNKINASMAFGLEKLYAIKRDLNYALASPLWDENARGYLIYLLNKTLEQIYKLENPIAASELNNSFAQQQQNALQQNAYQQAQQQQQQQNAPNIYEQLKPRNNVINDYLVHRHWHPTKEGPANANTRQSNEYLHQKGYVHHRPSTSNFQSHNHWSKYGEGPVVANNRNANNELHNSGYGHNAPWVGFNNPDPSNKGRPSNNRPKNIVNAPTGTKASASNISKFTR
tara:strand:+ start:46 stop:2091 length:2046 start_codon:yes stop_codon:yes gene_type:complete